jgi:hypothetical protein
MGSKGRCRCGSTVHRQALRYRCLTSPSPSQLNCVGSKLRNETATAYWLANRSERFASPWPTAKTAAMLREQDQYERLKALDMWPFGDLGRTEEQKPN